MKIELALAAAFALPASALAQYSAQVVGIGPGDANVPALSVLPGDSFSGAVILAGPAGIRNDSAVFRLVFTAAGLEFGPDWYQWGAPYVTGGPDDLTSPGLSTTGALNAATFIDPLDPAAIDVGFENLTPSFGQFFTTGLLLRFTLRVPLSVLAGTFHVAFADGSFTNGASSVSVQPTSSLTVTVIPAPATALVCALGLVAFRRRR